MFAWVVAAVAEPVALEHRIPASTQLGAVATALGGFDAWTDPTGADGGGVAGELRLAAATHRARAGGSDLSIGYGGLFEAWTDGVVDAHLVQAGTRHRSGLGGGVQGRGSASQQWAELGLPAQLRRDSWWVELGPALRGGTGLLVAGGIADAGWRWAPTRAVALDLGARLSAYADRDLPGIGVARARLTVDPSARTTLGTAISGLGAIGGVGLAVAGLPPADSGVLRPELWTGWRATGAVTLGIEAAVEIGAGSARYTRGRALAGVQVRLGRQRTAGVDIPAGEVRFSLDRPDAARVEVAGSFSDWRPLPMTRGDAGWELVLALEPGEWEYVYLVDGVQLVPPEAAVTRDDGFGGRNAVLVVSPSAM